jgi:hypothetical protein
MSRPHLVVLAEKTSADQTSRVGLQTYRVYPIHLDGQQMLNTQSNRMNKSGVWPIVVAVRGCGGCLCCPADGDEAKRTVGRSQRVVMCDSSRVWDLASLYVIARCGGVLFWRRLLLGVLVAGLLAENTQSTV